MALIIFCKGHCCVASFPLKSGKLEFKFCWYIHFKRPLNKKLKEYFWLFRQLVIYLIFTTVTLNQSRSLFALMKKCMEVEEAYLAPPLRASDLARLILVQFLSELMEMNEGDVEQLGIRETVMRRQLPLTQRARCRNFFWKTFTSC
uniref:Somatostatin/Cortistatin C-terminal domain-containing protein n=1 Tax=Neogobius melanostomus TaxID=47308 RepID=A0A8C6UJR1_9GOBI